MSPFKDASLILLVFLGLSIQISGEAQIEQRNVDYASGLFKESKFAEAKKICAHVLAGEPKDFQAVVLMGRIALLANRLAEAEKWLTKAIELKPGETEPRETRAWDTQDPDLLPSGH